MAHTPATFPSLFFSHVKLSMTAEYGRQFGPYSQMILHTILALCEINSCSSTGVAWKESIEENLSNGKKFKLWT